MIGDIAERFARAIVMPNLKPTVTTVAQAEDYRRRILASLPSGSCFQPLLTREAGRNACNEEPPRAAD